MIVIIMGPILTRGGVEQMREEEEFGDRGG